MSRVAELSYNKIYCERIYSILHMFNQRKEKPQNLHEILQIYKQPCKF